MNELIFNALRDRGCDQWTQIEAYRLALEDRVASWRRWSTTFGIATLVFGVLVGGSGTDFLNLISPEITKVTTPVFGVITALLAGLTQFLSFGEKIEKATVASQNLKTLSDKIVSQLYRLQREDDLEGTDEQLIFDQRADEFRGVTKGLNVDYRAYMKAATMERERSTFAALVYIGAVVSAEEAEVSVSIDEEAVDMQAFSRGA